MPATLDDELRKAIASGRVNAVTLWPTDDHRWQGNVRWKDSQGWSVHIDADAPTALLHALGSKERFTNPPHPRSHTVADKSAKLVVEGSSGEDAFDGLI